ncbi:PREDICTED: mucin-5AC-like isoform X1 [Cyprinodon variegatus]|uniref:mucin-5AC-like isoform X1 n=1 Tax=Cyprinodon variegatus TaxID=28743 RepID=UPI000742A17F|nr:PREDICTED: mucin-5AC-like isoform X1 [Cyprinodon variegatus]
MIFKPQVGPRAVSASSSRIMSPVCFMKDTGILCLFLSGLLLLPAFVSGVTTEMSTTSSATDSVSEASITTMLQVSTMEQTTTEANPQISSSTVSKTAKDTSTQSSTMVSGSSTVNPTQSIMSTTYGGTATSTAAPSPTTTLSSKGQTSVSTLSASPTLASSSTHSASPTLAPSSTHSASPTSGGSSPFSTHSPPTTSGGSALHSTLSVSSTLQDGMTAKNSTSNSSMDMIYCPSFSCNYSDCYSMYNSQNASACASGESCQLLRSMDMWYNVSCSASCAESCSNTTQTTCAVNCCNSTGCLSGNFASMMMTTTVPATTTTASPTTTTSTTANNGNKCQKGMCNGENCYQIFKNGMPETCSSMEPHCELKKKNSGSDVVWEAGCSNCTVHTACRGSSTTSCHLECCTATTTSCLMLNGTLNVPSFATRGPHLHIELITSLLSLLALSLLL